MAENKSNKQYFERAFNIEIFDEFWTHDASSFPGLLGCLRCRKPWDKPNRNTTNSGVFRK
jgi:hypothetical protein